VGLTFWALKLLDLNSTPSLEKTTQEQIRCSVAYHWPAFLISDRTRVSLLSLFLQVLYPVPSHHLRFFRTAKPSTRSSSSSSRSIAPHNTDLLYALELLLLLLLLPLGSHVYHVDLLTVIDRNLTQPHCAVCVALPRSYCESVISSTVLFLLYS